MMQMQMQMQWHAGYLIIRFVKRKKGFRMNRDFVVFNLDESPDRFSISDAIIEQEIADRPEEIKEAVRAYANGNLGASRFIAKRCKAFTTREEVEELIGWPLSGERQESSSALYDRFKP